ncbi:hypothetical protein RB195_025240 [Necator americanus]|uniref:Peptidase S1 domain-containing protein n=1 Tax=Necator americanus TaxID=51031 RepID=A0ABR1ETQ3_NECAM
MTSSAKSMVRGCCFWIPLVIVSMHSMESAAGVRVMNPDEPLLVQGMACLSKPYNAGAACQGRDSYLERGVITTLSAMSTLSG